MILVKKKIFSNCKFLLFADNLKLYLSINSVDYINHPWQNLESLSQWCPLNGLSINKLKYSFILFYHRKKQITLINNILGQNHEKCFRVHDLSLALSDDLNCLRAY